LRDGDLDELPTTAQKYNLRLRKIQMTAKMAVPRIYIDDAKDSRFDSYEVPLSLHDHAPPAAPFLYRRTGIGHQLCLLSTSTGLYRWQKPFSLRHGRVGTAQYFS
jgi:hypothetical protein